MRLIQELFGKSPFGPLVAHTKKVHECTKFIRPLVEALIAEDYEEIHRLQDRVSAIEYEADQIKHAIREQLPGRFFLPVEKADLESYLHCQDSIADSVQDFSVVLFIRDTRMHPDLADDFRAFAEQVMNVSDALMAASEQLEMLAETSFGGAEAEAVLEIVNTLGEAEWKADRMQRKISRHIYRLENELDPVTILFYEKMLGTLSRVANSAENTGDMLRAMIVKG